MQKFFTINDNFDRIIRQHLANIVSIEKIVTGWTNFVFIAKNARGVRYICRFPRNDFFADCLLKEIPFNRFVRNKVKVKTTWQNMHTDCGRAFSVHRMIPGAVLQDAYPNMTNEQKRTLAKDLATYICAFQEIKLKPMPVGHASASEFLINLGTVNNSPDFDKTRFDGLIRMEAQHSVPVHGDLNPGNIIVDESGRMIAVLDYAFVTHSAPINDVARIIGRLPSCFRPLMISAYQTASGHNVDEADMDYLIDLWTYVENDYKEYMIRECPDIKMPEY